jgi:hypothetical protein
LYPAAIKRNLTADYADTRGSIRTKNDKKIRDEKITGSVDRAIEKSDDRKIRGRKMKRGSTTKDTNHTKEKHGNETNTPQMDTDAHR